MNGSRRWPTARDLRPAKTESIHRADVDVAIGGVGATHQMCTLALAAQKPVLAVAGTGGDAEQVLNLQFSGSRSAGDVSGYGIPITNHRDALRVVNALMGSIPDPRYKRETRTPLKDKAS